MGALSVIAHTKIADLSLLGIGIYTPAEASRLTAVSPGRIRRWLRGHEASRRHYDRLWKPQIDIGDERIYLGFRDLTEVRVVDALIRAGLSAQRVRRAIQLARERYGFDRPLSTRRFRTDGRNVFLLIAEEERESLVDLFSGQYALREILEPSFKGLEFDEDGEPRRWHIAPGVLIDPAHAFGQPVARESLVPTSVLAAAAVAEGSAAAAARAYDVPMAAVQHAISFEESLRARMAA